MKQTTNHLTHPADVAVRQITRHGQISIPSASKNILIRPVHTPHIRQNLISVHYLTKYGDVTFTVRNATLYEPTLLPKPFLAAPSINGKYRYQHIHEALEERSHTSATNKPCRGENVPPAAISQHRPSNHREKLRASNPSRTAAPKSPHSKTTPIQETSSSPKHTLAQNWHTGTSY